MRPSGWLLGGLGLLAFLWGAGALPFLIDSDNGEIPWEIWAALTLFVSWGFVGAGLVAWHNRPQNGMGKLMVLTGFLFLVGALQGFENKWVYSIAGIFGAVFSAAAVHVLLAFPVGRLETRRERRMVTAAYLATTVGLLPITLFAKPSDYGCDTCPENALLITPEPVIASISLFGVLLVGIYVLASTARILIERFRRSGPRTAAARQVVLAGLALLSLLTLSLFSQLLGLRGPAIEAMNVAAFAALGLVPYMILAGLARVRLGRGGTLSDLLARLAEPAGPGELRDALSKAVGDPDLMLAYPLPSGDGYVDARGERVELPEPDSTHEVTYVELDGEECVAIVHDPESSDDPAIVGTVGRAAALALSNERLEAQLRAKVDELRKSRMRLIEVGMAERRALERNLHDGAQQRLVSMALNLRMAQGQLRTEPDSAERLLEGAAAELDLALKELRELARGIHPAVLSDRGLSAALDALAGRSPVPVEVAGAPQQRLPEPVELAAYYVVSEALANVAKYSQASRAHVNVARANGHVLVEVSDDGVGGADPERGTGLRGLSDRMRALEGRLDVESFPGRGTKVRASIPCE